MIPEIGHFSLILAFGLAILQAFIPLLGMYQKRESLMRVARPLSVGQCFFVLVSFLLLIYAFFSDDFSLTYVARHSNSTLPLIYKLVAVWGGHEGSLLLWVVILSGWTLCVNVGSRSLTSSSAFVAGVLAVMGIISIGFMTLLLTTSNPFARWLPNYPMEGADLNPLLQDPGLIIHPPLLYLGYVGFSVPFAFAISSLLQGKMEAQWLKWICPYALCALSFLTIGIALGSWWAYYELGWGGWWFWDPVENVSFMPWIVGIGLVHSLIISTKRHNYLALTALLSIITFGLSLLGTFLVRSGVLSSVHAFATDPKRGLVMLQFLIMVIGGALTLYALRVNRLAKNIRIEWYSRESLILVSIVFLLVGAGTVLLGTVFPLFYEAFTDSKISVGFPYFNMVFVPLLIPVLGLIPLGPFTRFGGDRFVETAAQLKWALILSIVLSFLLPLLVTHAFSIGLWLGLILGLWVCLGTLQRLIFKLKKGFTQVSLGAWGMCFAHFGVGVMVIGITLVSFYQIEREVKIAPTESVTLGEYEVTFQSLTSLDGPNFVGYRGHFRVTRPNHPLIELFPEKRIFLSSGTAMSETAIDPGFFRDIYIALGEKLSGESWSARIYYKPFVRWIWLGALMIALGALLAALKGALKGFRKG